MINSRILTVLGAVVLIGDQVSLASAATRHHLVGPASGASFAAIRAESDNPLADRAETLGGKAFTMERAEGVTYTKPNAAADSGQTAGNPLKERAETLAGKAFSAERAEAVPYRASASASTVVSDEVVGNPLKDRAEALAGKAFTVEGGSEPAVAHFLAEYR